MSFERSLRAVRMSVMSAVDSLYNIACMEVQFVEGALCMGSFHG
jgi:hypothetical protein